MILRAGELEVRPKLPMIAILSALSRVVEERFSATYDLRSCILLPFYALFVICRDNYFSMNLISSILLTLVY